MTINGRYIRGFICPKYDAEKVPVSSGKKSLTEIAKEVLAGKWGNGDSRKAALRAAGYSYEAVQAKVNALCSPGTADLTKIAKEVLAGKWGNGAERQERLAAAGYDPAEVQKLVNTLF